ncbi:MAG: phosphate ABC transporter permease subunit PstC [Reyranellaceae bacterium]
MSLPVVLAVLLVLTLLGFRLGMGRALQTVNRRAQLLHSRPGYYGSYVALWALLPATGILLAWLPLEPLIVEAMLRGSLPAEVAALPESRLGLILNTINNLSHGGIVAGTIEPYMKDAAAQLQRLRGIGAIAMAALVFAAAALGLLFAMRRVTPQMRARNIVERIMRYGLILCSTIAVLTTVGIVLSMLFETIRFFSFVNPIDFFLGTVWDPRFAAADNPDASGQFGLLPLLWGTIFISLIAMLVAVPIGLLSAIYLSEYASRRFRAAAKPLLEILAGIPTVVYGFFALTTVGPFLRELGDAVGLDVSATSALAAGTVMGIMIIPFVSSLSDDIINAVPQSLREGSYGLGATQSETIKRVIFPAALPGIVGAVLLAISRAIGETMIVVMAAGIAANLTLNPFESVTTVTVKIVSQLTGDLEFTSPQTLVAFALGLTLFFMTLGLNVYALHIVRKYREQYD